MKPMTLNRDLLLNSWAKLSKLPFGKSIFSQALGHFVPYSGSIRGVIEELRPGFAKVTLTDRKKVRNHLHSIHAIALANLGEMATGLSLHTVLPPEFRAILVKFEIEYLKKARGKISAECPCDLTEFGDNTSSIIEGKILDQSGSILCVVRATWKLGRARHDTPV